MLSTLKTIIRNTAFKPQPLVLGPVEAYNIWAENYDHQPGNLMLDLDEQVFTDLLKGIILKNKHIADIGCGTGRHWDKLFKLRPASLTGFDVSAGMLGHLQSKYPGAHTQVITGNLFPAIADATYDVIVSTLTIAHIENLEQALQAWSRILKTKADIIITDFHPNVLAFGGQRTFEHDKKQLAVKNFVHHVSDITALLAKYNFALVKLEEKIIDERVKHYYTAKNALHVYARFKGSEIIYGMHLRRTTHAAE